MIRQTLAGNAIHSPYLEVVLTAGADLESTKATSGPCLRQRPDLTVDLSTIG